MKQNTSATVTESILLNKMQVKITRVASVDRLYAALVAKGDAHADVLDERIPYWADLWHSAIGLAHYLVENRELVEGRQVLEIGCGLGLPGLVAARLGAEVTMTDYIEAALTSAADNAAQNGINKIVFRQMDWRKPDAALAAHVVLASDVAYESRSFDTLPATFRTLLKPGGLALVSEPGRTFAENFFDSLGNAFTHSVFEKPVTYRDITLPVKIHVLRMNQQ